MREKRFPILYLFATLFLISGAAGLISIDSLRKHTAGHNNLYSEGALETYRSHLTPFGVKCAWMADFHIILYTAAQVFPYVDQFENESVIAGFETRVQ